MTEKTNKNKKIVQLSEAVECYSRRTDILGKNRVSLLFDKFCEQHNKKIINKYNEDVLSGRGFKRPILEKLMNSNNGYDIIIDDSTSISRDEEEFKRIGSKFKRLGKNVYSISNDMFLDEMCYILKNKHKYKFKKKSKEDLSI